MKTSSILAFLFIGAVVFYVSGGNALLGLGGVQGELPETTKPRNATFMGTEQQNPYASEAPVQPMVDPDLKSGDPS